MRILLLLLPLPLLACTSSKVECEDGTSPVDGVCDEDSDSDPVEPDPHPNVPDEYRYLWQVDGCTRSNGSQGNQVYWLGSNGRVESDGSFSITERFYWFWAEEGWEDDCIDTFVLTGQVSANAPSAWGFSESEEAYDVTRVMIEDNCDISYRYMFEYGTQNEDQTYELVLIFDTLNASGNPNEDDKMLVIANFKDAGGGYESDINYARGTATPDAEVPGPPASYTWNGDECRRAN